jgi:hypothetical protein
MEWEILCHPHNPPGRIRNLIDDPRIFSHQYFVGQKQKHRLGRDEEMTSDYPSEPISEELS